MNKERAAAVVSVGARCALAGNPSDGFDGAVLATMVPGFSATALLVAKGGEPTLDLVQATIERFDQNYGPGDGERIGIESNIARSVGLAGSSAIVIATIRILAQLRRLSLSDMDVARLAHTVERIDLGIAGGWQDQVVQAHGVTALMEFAEPISHQPIAAPHPPIPLYLAWSEETAQDSGIAHTRLRGRARTPELDHQMADLADLARAAADAVKGRNVHELKAAIDGSFDIRTELMDISPEWLEMVTLARELGASANFAGSGGAIVGVLPKDGQPFLDALEEAGLSTHSWDLA